VLDDYSRYLIAWKLFTTMAAGDVKTLLDLAISKTGVDKINVRHRSRLLSDNGSCYISKELKDFMRERELSHIRGQPYHPMTQRRRQNLNKENVNSVCI
jgi:putative transposase